MIDPHPSPAVPDPRRGPSLAAIRAVVLLYAVFSALWILFSDKAVRQIFSDPDTVLLANTLKGWFFVAITAILLYLLLRRLLATSVAEPQPLFPLRSLVLPGGILFVVIAGLTAIALIHTVDRAGRQAEASLHAIADLKASELGAWLKARRMDATLAAGNEYWLTLYRQWRQTGDAQSGERLHGRLDWFRQVYGYTAVLLLSEEGESLWSSEGVEVGLAPELAAFTARAAIRQAPGGYDFFRDGSGRWRLDVVAPVLAGAGQAGPLIVLEVDPTDYLFPTLQSWPLSSASGEILLCRRDGDQVLVLNDLRHRDGAAGKMRLPVAAEDLLTSKVVLGKNGPEGQVLGLDYRGVPSCGAVRAIPGTEWFLLVKIDQAETYAEARADMAWITLTGLMAFGALGAGAYLLRQRQELALMERERQLREDKMRALQLLDAIASSSTDFIYAKDGQGRYLFCNQAAADFLGRPLAEILGHGDTDILPAELAASIMAVDRQVLDRGEAASWSYEVTAPGRTRTILATEGPLRDPQGEVMGLFGISRDISELHQAQQALAESEATYRSLFTNMLNAVAYFQVVYENGQPSDLRYLTVNAAHATLTGLGAEVVGRRISEVLPGIRADNPGECAACIRVAMGGAPERFEAYILALRSWLAVSVFSPRPGHLVIVFDDISERKRAEAALRQSEATLARAQAIAHVGCWRLSHYGGDLLWSAETYRIFELPEGTALTYQDFLSFLHPEDRERVLRAREEALDNPPYDIEFRIVVGEGKVKWVRGQGEMVVDADGRRYIGFGAVHDITARKQAEEERGRLVEQLAQAQKLESVGRLAGGVAHDFNNMLSVILGYTDLCLMQVSPGDELYPSLLEIHKAGKRSADLTRQLLAFARKQVIDPTLLNLNDTTEGMLKMLRRLIGEDVELIWTPGPGLWPVMMDASQVDQILANLCVNARDAMAGGGRVSIETANVRLAEGDCLALSDCVPGDYVRLTVSDTGAGMTAEVMAHAFEPFFTTKGLGQGTGLGLATVYGIVKQNQGCVAISSHPGQGSTIAIYLPPAPEEGGTLAAEAGAEETALGQGETVLLVEDEPAILHMVQAMLEGLGYQVLAANTPMAALALMETGGRVDVLLTDIIMPEMSGRELAERLMALRPGVKCLYMSGYTADEIGQHGVLDRGVNFIQKPFSRHNLALRLREALQGP